MQIESGAHSEEPTRTAGGNTSHETSLASLPNTETPLLESGAYYGSELRTHYGVRSETPAQAEESDAPPSYHEVIRGRFLQMTPGDHGFEFDI